MLVSINMYANTHCGASKNPLKDPSVHRGSLWGEASERACLKNLDLYLHVHTKVGDATLKSHYKKKRLFTRTRSIYLFQYRGFLACWCLSICMPTPTVRLQKSPKDPFGPQGAPVGESERASVCQESCFVLACSHQGR